MFEEAIDQYKYADTRMQIADLFTKALNDTRFRKLYYIMNGW